MFNKLISQTRQLPGIRGAAMAMFTAAALGFAPCASAGLLTWSITGPGTSSSSQIDSTTSLSYELYSNHTWIATAVADDASDYTFDWGYSGFHAFFQVTAFQLLQFAVERLRL